MALLALLAACGLREVLPGPPVAGPTARAAYDADVAACVPGPAGCTPVAYLDAPRSPFPVPPLQAWGLRYALDLVLVSNHPDWVMHEYARVDVPGNPPLWLAKDAGVDREQTIIADVADLERWVPEAPVRRIQRPVQVEDRSTPEEAVLDLRYLNPLGQTVELSYRGAMPTAPSSPRNGNTMGHSKQSVAALLDLYAFRIGGQVVMEIDGVQRELHKLAGLLPEVYLLAQVQAGFAITDFCASGTAQAFAVRRPCKAESWPTRAEETWTVANGWAVREGPLTTLRYQFVDGETSEIVVEQAGAPEPLLRARFWPRVPDVRRRWAGETESAFVVDVNGQPGHGTGTVRAAWTDAGVSLALVPNAPHWFADRPMAGAVTWDADEAYVSMWRADVDPR